MWCLKDAPQAGWWWHTPLIPALGRQRQEDFWVRGQPGLWSEFQDSQGNTEKPCLEKPKPKQTKTKTNQYYPSIKPDTDKKKNEKKRRKLQTNFLVKIYAKILNKGWWDGSVGKSTRLLFQRSGVQIPATTWWLTTTCNWIWCLFLCVWRQL